MVRAIERNNRERLARYRRRLVLTPTLFHTAYHQYPTVDNRIPRHLAYPRHRLDRIISTRIAVALSMTYSLLVACSQTFTGPPPILRLPNYHIPRMLALSLIRAFDLAKCPYAVYSNCTNIASSGLGLPSSGPRVLGIPSG